MIYSDVDEFTRSVDVAGKFLVGLDISKNRLGVASSDVNMLIATPKFTIKRTKFLDDIKPIIDLYNRGACAIVVGAPVELDGSKSKRYQSVYDFCCLLIKHHANINIIFQDERFSTKVAKKHMFWLKNDVDDVAAAWFLQAFIDTINLKR